MMARPSTQLRPLLVEDSEDDAALLLRELSRSGYEPIWKRVDTSEGMKNALDEEAWDIVFADYAMPQFSAPAALALLQESGLDLPFIVISGTVGEDVAVATMLSGAHDYLMKGNLTRLGPAIERELRQAEMRKGKKRAEDALQQHVEELERSNAELEQFAYVASHDLQEPLRIITNYCDLVQKRYRGKLDADADEFLGFAAEAANRMRELVRGLLAYARVRHDARELEEIDCDLVLREALT